MACYFYQIATDVCDVVKQAPHDLGIWLGNNANIVKKMNIPIRRSLLFPRNMKRGKDDIRSNLDENSNVFFIEDKLEGNLHFSLKGQI